MSSVNATAAEKARHSSETSQKLSTKPTPLDVAASASELAAANAATLRRRVLGVAAAELRALPSGRVSLDEVIGLLAGVVAWIEEPRRKRKRASNSNAS